MNRSKTYAASGEMAVLHDAKRLPVVRPDLSVPDETGTSGPNGKQRLRQFINL